jgi:hypothetical protein
VKRAPVRVRFSRADIISKKEWVCKPSSVSRKTSRAAVIYLDQLLPVGSPVSREATYQLLSPGPSVSYLVLQAVGFTVPAPSPMPRCAFTAPFHHCLCPEIGVIGCVFSVALSRGSPRVAVSHHRALSCSDFPPAEAGRRPPDPLFSIDCRLLSTDNSAVNCRLL